MNFGFETLFSPRSASSAAIIGESTQVMLDVCIKNAFEAFQEAQGVKSLIELREVGKLELMDGTFKKNFLSNYSGGVCS